ncbi:MAG TPA: hypothetical protein DCL49_01280 [Candidatus Omnitrophica bacterium]|nr:hypothetical protein [Candidatus Omnitrophota bacterium]
MLAEHDNTLLLTFALRQEFRFNYSIYKLKALACQGISRMRLAKHKKLIFSGGELYLVVISGLPICFPPTSAEISSDC